MVAGEEEEKILIKLTDFGFACNTKTDRETKNISCGTIYFMAPELLKDRVKNISEKVDIWAVGVITHYLLTGKYPFEGIDYDEIRENILSGCIKYDCSLSPIAK